MNNRVQDINNIFKYLTEENNSEEYNTFFALLRGLKDYSPLLNFYGIEFIKDNLELLSRIEDKYDKALLIETITESEIFSEQEDYNSCYHNLFDEYISILTNNGGMGEDVIRCLKNFINIGISSNEIFIKIAKNLEKDIAITILAGLGDVDWGIVEDELLDFLEEVRTAYKIQYRSGLIAHFLVIVNPLCRKYVGVSQISFAFSTYEAAYSDWPWSKPHITKILIESKIISQKEANIFNKLGGLLIDMPANVHSEEIKKLYYEFFEDKDPFDIIYTLPE